MSQEERRKDLQEFKAKALALVEGLKAKGLPSSCSLSVFVGKDDISRLDILLRSCRGRSLGLYIYEKPATPEAGLSFEAAAFASGKAAACAIDLDSNAHLFKLESVVSIFNAEGASFSVEASFEAGNGKAVREIDGMLRRSVANFRMLKNGLAIHSRAAALNLPLLKRGVRLSAASRIPKDAVVCGAGPSLSQDLPAIAALKGRALIIAVGHAMKGLVSYGIEPDIAVEVETMSRLNWPEGPAPSGCVLAAPLSVDPLVSSKFSRILWLSDDFSGLSSLCPSVYEGFLELAQVAGVIVSAVDLAAKLGCERIALTGSDLCLSKEGASHYGEGADKKELDVLKPVESYDGERLLSSDDFISIKESLEAHLGKLLKANPPVQAWNCSKGGAKLLNCGRAALESVFDGSPEGAKSLVFEQAPLKEDALAAGLRTLEKELLDLSSCLAESCSLASALGSALRAQVFNEAGARDLQRRLGEAAAKDQACRSRSFQALFSRLSAQASLWSSESPRGLALTEDPASILDAFSFERRLLQGLASDLAGDAAYVSTPSSLVRARDNASFPSFAKLAAEIVSESNPEFGKALLEPGFFGPIEGIFLLRSSWQNLPSMDKIFPDGASKRLQSQRSMEREAQKEVASFLKSGGKPFDAKEEALLLLFPGNWLHAIELAKAAPGCRLIVVEPWPELLSKLIFRSMFMHLLPKGALVIGVHERLPSWPLLLRAALEGFESDGLKTRAVIPSFARELPELQPTLKKLVSEAGDALSKVLA